MMRLHELTEHKGRMRRCEPGAMWLHWHNDGTLRYDNEMVRSLGKDMLTCDWEIEDVGVTITTKEFWEKAENIMSKSAYESISLDEVKERIAKAIGLGPKP